MFGRKINIVGWNDIADITKRMDFIQRRIDNLIEHYCDECGCHLHPQYVNKVEVQKFFDFRTKEYCGRCKPPYDRIVGGRYFKDNVECDEKGKLKTPQSK